MKIAYASKDPEHLRQIAGYLHRYYDSLSIPVDILLFDDPDEMIESMQKNDYRLILLDLIYDVDTGVNVSYRIRKYNPYAPIVLMQRREDGRVECFFNYPTSFILDELSERYFVPLLDAMRSILYTMPQRTILLNTLDNQDRIVPLMRIAYAEAMGHRVIVHLITGEKLEVQGPIKRLADRLSAYTEFLYPHRSFIVNAIFVSCITANALYLRMPLATIPIARGKACEVRKAYDHYFHAFDRDNNLQACEQMPCCKSSDASLQNAEKTSGS